MNKTNNILLSILLILTVISIGMIGINQTMGYIYKTQLGKTPCKLCVEQNPQYKGCIEQVNTEPHTHNIDIEALQFDSSTLTTN